MKIWYLYIQRLFNDDLRYSLVSVQVGEVVWLFILWVELMVQDSYIVGA